MKSKKFPSIGMYPVPKIIIRADTTTDVMRIILDSVGQVYIFFTKIVPRIPAGISKNKSTGICHIFNMVRLIVNIKSKLKANCKIFSFSSFSL